MFSATPEAAGRGDSGTLVTGSDRLPGSRLLATHNFLTPLLMICSCVQARRTIAPARRDTALDAGGQTLRRCPAAKATAHTEHKLIVRIALIDGPLRDIQLLGFAALIIVGVSQRFAPQVYGLERPARDRQSLIFWLINGSLILNIVRYVLLLTTHELYLAFGLEVAYLLMPIWAFRLARQIGVFSKPSQPDRTFKFVRTAYIWLLFSCVMMPFFPLYGVLTRQVFAYTYMGSHRHAFTVEFISLMIMGVSSRVVPILAGMDARRILINFGCSIRWWD